MAVIEAPFRFFKIQEEIIFCNSFEFPNSVFNISPEGFNAVDMILLDCELVATVINNLVVIFKK